jgi:hypothetical protein
VTFPGKIIFSATSRRKLNCRARKTIPILLQQFVITELIRKPWQCRETLGRVTSAGFGGVDSGIAPRHFGDEHRTPELAQLARQVRVGRAQSLKLRRLAALHAVRQLGQ